MPLQLVPFGRLTFTANRVRRSRKGVLSGVATSGVDLLAPKGLGFGEPRLLAHCPGNEAPALNSRGAIISLVETGDEQRLIW